MDVIDVEWEAKDVPAQEGPWPKYSAGMELEIKIKINIQRIKMIKK